jgi:hypothetical protein
MGGRSGQSIGSVGSGGGNVTLDDFKYASQKSDYESDETDMSIEDQTINAYSNYGYRINGKIHRNDLDSIDKTYIKNMDKSLDKLPNYKGEVYRGIKTGNINDFSSRVGENIKFKGYTSTSKDKEIANDFGKHISFVIKSKRGKNIEKQASAEYEKEILFKRNTKFKINKVEGRTVHLSEI